jgi:hypothetical protein
MDSLKRLPGLLLILTLVVLIGSGCTKKDNLTGNNWSDVRRLTVDDKNGIANGYSFPAETLSETKGTETKLLTANYRNATSIAYMRFTGLPDADDLVSLEHADSCYLSLKILKRSPVSREPINLKLYKVTKALPDTLTTLGESDLEEITGSSYAIADTISIIGELIKMPLSLSSIFNWSEGDSTGWNMALKVDTGWLEIASAEASYGPTLHFNYKIDSEATSYTSYQDVADRDSYVLTAPLATISTQWKIDNLSSQRMFIKYILQDSVNTMFRDNAGNSLSQQDIRRMTINQAKLILHVKPGTNSYYTGSSTYSLYPFNVVKEDLADLSPLVKADYEIITYTAASTGLVSGDSVEVDITPLVQAYTSGDKEPYGIMLQSMQERLNFGSLEFYDNLGSTPEEKRPYIRITYTPPFL